MQQYDAGKSMLFISIPSCLHNIHTALEKLCKDLVSESIEFSSCESKFWGINMSINMICIPLSSKLLNTSKQFALTEYLDRPDPEKVKTVLQNIHFKKVGNVFMLKRDEDQKNEYVPYSEPEHKLSSLLAEFGLGISFYSGNRNKLFLSIDDVSIMRKVMQFPHIDDGNFLLGNWQNNESAE
jgi:hypothetical protein